MIGSRRVFNIKKFFGKYPVKISTPFTRKLLFPPNCCEMFDDDVPIFFD
jgi:hypothetical protein